VESSGARQAEAPASQTSHAGDVPATGAIEVTALPRSNLGRLACSLFASSAGFPANAEAAVARVVAKIEAGRAVCRFDHVAPGEYAVAILHDENENGRMDTNFLGVPSEGWGASNDAPPGFASGPSWDDAKVSFAGGTLRLDLRLRY
jgi:uncharacterized protein (DUF2141 family)